MKIEVKRVQLEARAKAIEQEYQTLKAHLDRLAGEYAKIQNQLELIDELTTEEDDEEGNLEMDQPEAVRYSGDTDPDDAAD